MVHAMLLSTFMCLAQKIFRRMSAMAWTWSCVNSLVSTWNCRAAVGGRRKKLVVGNVLPVCSWCIQCTTTPQPTSLLGPQEEVLMPLGELLSLEDGDQGVFALAGPSPDLLGRHFTDGPAKPNCNCYSIIHAQAISLILSRSNFNGIQ